MMEAAYCFGLGGAAFGCAVAVLWFGIDLLLGVQSITLERFGGLVLICAVCALPAVFIVATILDAIEVRRSDLKPN